MSFRHNLKLYDEYWFDVKCGRKSFEVRKNDRGYQLGDVVVFYRYSREPRGYLGYYDGKDDYQYIDENNEFVETENEAESMMYQITYVFPLAIGGINYNYVVFGISKLLL